MKNLIKLSIASFVLFVACSANAQKGELLLSTSKAGKNIDISFELLNDGNVSAIQFDIQLPKDQTKSLNKKACTVSMGNSSLAGCSVNGNILRVAIIQEGLGQIQSGELGHVSISGANGILNKKLIVSNAKLISSKGVETSIQAVIDYKDVKVLDLNDSDFERK